MRIVELTAWQVRIPLRKPIRHASHTRTDTDNLVVRCTLDDGTDGFGEGVPREYVTGETIDSALDLLKRSDLRGPARRLPRLRRRGRAGRAAAAGRRSPATTAAARATRARCAVELALLDAYGQHFGEPLSRRDAAGSRRTCTSRAAACATAARSPRPSGCKLRLAGVEDVALRLRAAQGEGRHRRARTTSTGCGAIRSRVGRQDGPAHRRQRGVVAGRASRERILELKPFGITSVEQPVPHEQVARPGRGAQAGRRADHARRIAVRHGRRRARPSPSGTCDLFNLRLSKCGGFIPSLRLAQFARRHGLGYQLGCQVGETAILSAAGRHFAAASRDLRYVEGSYDRHLVREALATRDLTFGWGGWAPALRGPGPGHRPSTRRPSSACHRARGGAAWVTADRSYTVEEYRAGDGYRWQVPPLSRGRRRRGPSVVFIHGIQSHAGWYEHSCTQLAGPATTSRSSTAAARA